MRSLQELANAVAGRFAKGEISATAAAKADLQDLLAVTEHAEPAARPPTPMLDEADAYQLLVLARAWMNAARQPGADAATDIAYSDDFEGELRRLSGKDSRWPMDRR